MEWEIFFEQFSHVMNQKARADARKERGALKLFLEAFL